MPYLPLDLEGHALRLFRRPLLLGRISPTSFSLWLFGLRVGVWEGVKFHATLKGALFNGSQRTLRLRLSGRRGGFDSRGWGFKR